MINDKIEVMGQELPIGVVDEIITLRNAVGLRNSKYDGKRVMLRLVAENFEAYMTINMETLRLSYKDSEGEKGNYTEDSLRALMREAKRSLFGNVPKSVSLETQFS